MPKATESAKTPRSITLTPGNVEELEEITEKIDAIACLIGEGGDYLSTVRPFVLYGVLEYPIADLRKFVASLTQQLKQQGGAQ